MGGWLQLQWTVASVICFYRLHNGGMDDRPDFRQDGLPTYNRLPRHRAAAIRKDNGIHLEAATPLP